MMVQSQRRNLVALAPLIVAIIGVAVVLFGVPLRSILVPGLFLLCPLAMLFMHGAHGHEDHDDGTGQRPPGPAHRSEGREGLS